MDWIITLIFIGIVIFLLLIMALMRAASASDAVSEHYINIVSNEDDRNSCTQEE